MENMMLKFQGFHPSDFTRSYLEDKMTILQHEAPYGARMEASFTRHNQDFKGIVTILSPAGKFFAIASGTKLKDVTHKINEQLKKQFGKWKAKVHKKESIRDMNDEFFGIA